MIKGFVPKEYRDLLDYISPAAFKVLDWKKAMAQFIQMSKHAFDAEYVLDLASYNLAYFADIVSLSGDQAYLCQDEMLSNSNYAAQIVDIYFSQFFSDRGSLIDLRLKHFTREGSAILFSPGPFVHVFEKRFRQGMLAIYEGYYLQNPETMESGMLQVGLIKSRNQQEVEETKTLLFAHFGDADQGPTEFNLDHFKDSFHELFLYLKKKNIRLSSDFLFLGIYLVTLYLALSKLGQSVDVKKCFINSWDRNS